MSQQVPGQRESAGARFARLLRPFGFRLGLTITLLGLLTFTDMVQPFALKLLIDDVFPLTSQGDGEWGLLWFILPGLAVAYVARNALFYASRMVALGISEDVCFHLRQRLFEHLQRLNLRFYRSHQPGKVSSRLMDDTFKIQSFIQDKLPMFLRYLLEFQVLLLILYVVNWRLALASSIVLPLHLVVYRLFRVPIRRSHSEAQENIAAAHGNVIEKFLGAEVVKGFSGEERERRQFDKAIDASRRSQIRSQRYHFAQKVAADLAVGLGTVLLLGYGAWEVSRGQMKPGAFFMFFIYVKMLYPAVLEIISGLGHLSRTTASVDRVFEMLGEPIDEPEFDDRSTIGLTELAGNLRFDDVSFAYEPGQTVLEDISFEIEFGEHVAITGSSGSGKSTLISLLPRFNDPVSGRVLVDGRDVRTIPTRDLRGLFGIAFQEVFLFNASIDENLRYAKPDATFEEVVEACRITGADEFIRRLPNGYFTRIGTTGGELSRGEKQRLTLARALIRDPRVLILDEATASIDSRAADEIMARIFERMKDRTIIMVTHDSDLLRHANRVIRFPDRRSPAGPTEDVPMDERDHRETGPPEASQPDVSAGRNAEEPPGDDDSSGEQAPRRSSEGGRRRGKTGRHLRMLSTWFSIVVLGSCMSEKRTERTLELDDPRLSGGVILEESDPDRLLQMADALDALELEPPGGSLSAARVNQTVAESGLINGTLELPDLSVREAASLIPENRYPADATTYIPLPKMSSTELDELIDRLAEQMISSHGYGEGGTVLVDQLTAPRGVNSGRIIARRDGEALHLIHIGYRTYVSQPGQLWVLGVMMRDDQDVSRSDDLDLVEPVVLPMITAMNDLRAGVTISDLESKLVQLSYVDAPAAMTMLASMGITTITDAKTAAQDVTFDKLPMVVMMPDPAKETTGLVGSSTVSGGGVGKFGISLAPSVASALSENTIASPLTQLVVMFHPAHPEQFSRVRKILDDYIDRPARQIFIEGMVLEIKEDGLKDLGIEWELDQSPIKFKMGTTDADRQDDTLFFESLDLDWWRVFTRDFPYVFEARVRALISDGKAEILARPSVLTLNNRQSTIRVGTDIPIATSQEGTGVSSKISFDFSYLPTGILLNIRPRINEMGDEVSLLVDTIVSARVPNADLEIRSFDGVLLATAPTISTRRVQTYARIRNNTPFIVGGLVSREMSTIEDKVPLLGDLPLIGGLFRAEKTQTEKTEVIIVITPYVLPEDQLIARSLPRDEDAFDSFGNELFRDSYRIRTEDVYDLSFLLENRRLNRYRELAQEAIDFNFRLAEQEPYSAFARERVPGEEILVTRMIYEVIKRLKTDEAVLPDRMIFFEGQQVGGFDVKFLDRVLTQLGNGLSRQAFFNNEQGKALALTYFYDRESLQEGHLDSEPIPEVRVVDCPGREAWKRMLWEMNQPRADGRQQFTVLLQNEGDIVRLRRALALKRIVTLNGGESQLLLRNFSVGKVLLMPDIKPMQAHVIDADVARFFFYTEHYYAATIQAIEEALTKLDAELRVMMPETVPELGQPAAASLK